MKKIISLLLVCVLLVCCVFALASCEKRLEGTYRNADGGATYVFEGDTVKRIINIFGFEKEDNGTYKISENHKDEVIITMFWDDGDEDDSNNDKSKFVLLEGAEGGTKYIKLDGTQYNKVED